MLSLKEWNLDNFMYRFFWMPMKLVGKKLSFLNTKNVFILFITVFIVGTFALEYEEEVPNYIHKYLPEFFAILGLLLVIKSFSERNNVILSWILILMNHFLIALALSFNEKFDADETLIYLSGVFAAGMVGLICLNQLKKKVGNLDLNEFHGYSYKNTTLAFVFFVSCLGLSGFPITPTFIGEDLIFGHIKENQVFLAFLVAVSFIIDGFSLIRIYSRLFLGPHSKRFHDVGYRSA